MNVLRLGCAVAALCASAAPAQTVAPIRLNQVGLLPDGVKIAVLPNSSPNPLTWELSDTNGRIVGSGRTQVFGSDAFSAEHVHRIDFSEARSEGSGYRLKIGSSASRPFTISGRTYDRLPHDALAFFYHQRSGTPIEARFVGGPWARPAGHPREVVTCVSGTDAYGNKWPGCAYSLDVTGGWYDAGDHGKYVVNGGISLWTLLNLYEVHPTLFGDGSERIPEAGNGVSDLLDEARWEMEFMLRMQVPDGSRQRLPVGAKRLAKGLSFKDVDTSGMAHHKISDEKWTSLPMRPEADPERRVLFPPSTAATLNLAATAAQCARIWQRIDPAFSARCLVSAERAWAAAKRNPEVYAVADFGGGSGAYGDSELSDEVYWAAAELLETTQKEEYRRAIQASPHFRTAIREGAGWASVATLGTITLATGRSGIGAADRERLRREIVSAAGLFISDVRRTGYAVPMASNWTWGSTSNLLDRAMLLALAYDWTGERKYRDAVVDSVDFILGRNPLDRSFVSGYGARPMQNPHHRFWAHSLDPKLPPPPPGALSGGPNHQSMADDVAARMKGKCAPQTCWADDIHAYSLNEVAINWNAPLVWVSAWLADTSKSRPKAERG